MTKKTGPDAYGALVHHPKLNVGKYVVSVLVSRRDGKPMTPADLDAAARAYPREEEEEPVLDLDPPAAPAAKPAGATKAKPAPKGPSKKRAAAKRPARAR